MSFFFSLPGARMDRGLVLQGIAQYPKEIKIYTVFGHSPIGRIRDCKVQHWIKGLDCIFRVEGNMVIALLQGKEFRLSVGEFSLRNHFFSSISSGPEKYEKQPKSGFDFH